MTTPTRIIEDRHGSAGARRAPAGGASIAAGVARRAGDELGAAIVAVGPGLGHHDAHRALRAHDFSACFSRSPTAWMFARSPGTSVQSKPLPSFSQRGITCRW